MTKPVTLRRDGKGPLKFTGERIGDASRNRSIEDDSGELKSYEISTRLYRTPSGKYVAGVEVYNRTDEEYDTRDGWTGASLEELVKEINSGKHGSAAWFDDDILAELFEKTEIANHFVEQID